MDKIPGEVIEVAKFLSFFAEARMYAPIDKLAKPFTYEDVINALEDALRQASVIVSSSYEKEITTDSGKKKVRVVKIRGEEEILAPYIPKQEVIKRFLELCKEDLTFAKEAATLSLTYRFKVL